MQIRFIAKQSDFDSIPGSIYGYWLSESVFSHLKNDEMLEYAQVHYNDYYGTPRSHIKEKLEEGYDVLLEIDIQGAIQIKEKVSEAIFIFILVFFHISFCS